MREQLRRIWRDSKGATAVEYGLILALIFIVSIGAVVLVADATITMWGNVSDVVVKN